MSLGHLFRSLLHSEFVLLSARITNPASSIGRYTLPLGTFENVFSVRLVTVHLGSRTDSGVKCANLALSHGSFWYSCVLVGFLTLLFE